MSIRKIRYSTLLAPLGVVLLAALTGCGGDIEVTDNGTTSVVGSTSGTSSSSSSSSSSGSSSSSSSSSGSTSTGSLSAPSNVQIVLQGQDAQEQSNSAVPTQPNHLTIAWKSVTGATSYKIYRSVNQGSYALYATVSASAATTAYSSYVSKSGNYDYQTNVDSAYQDTAATNSVGYPKTADSAGTYFPNNVGYTYKVSAVDADGEGTLSTDSIAIYFAGGLQITNESQFDGVVDFADTTASVASPLGYTTNAKWSVSSGHTITGIYSGHGAVDQNFCLKGFNYLILSVMAGQSGSSFRIGTELSGDQALLTADLSSTSYNTLVANQWVTFKIPLSDLMIDQVGGTDAPQYAFYKYILSTPSSATQTFWLESYFSVN
ncbi:MAG: hypothetical protein QM718_04475 [Steroidobacteraceae bacterium]